MSTIKGRFNSKEMAEIEYAVDEYCNDYERRMDQKIAEVGLKWVTPTDK
ncbi:MAG: hypothetical protein IJT30_09710 [Muribaculaceae bacterium]|nr:hypothetical protein [Muribaculaceae bacterium]